MPLTIRILSNAFLALLLCNVIMASRSAAQIVIPESHAHWAFTSTAPPDSWTTLEFDDASWDRGSAPLGYGDEGIVTPTRKPDAKQDIAVTTYFRTKFRAEETAKRHQLRVKIRVDDGFAAYLNGHELARWNLPPGELKHDTLATRGLSSPEELLYQEFSVPADRLVAGDNMLAIEVHQASRSSTDQFLDVRLLVRQTSTTHHATTAGEALEISERFNSKHYIDFTTRIPDGFLDGGRGVQVDEFGNAVSGREIMRVDRDLDPQLQQHLKFARSAELRDLNPVDRATHIARYIDRVMTPPDGHDSCEPRSMFLGDRYAGREVLLGDVTDYCGAGVCRHRSLLFKIMADEAGLEAALVRGNFGTDQRGGGHAWNELRLADGTIVIVDVMNPQPDFYFPKLGEPSLRFYRTIANAVKYPTAESVGATGN
jgi:hypothetical protein